MEDPVLTKNVEISANVEIVVEKWEKLFQMKEVIVPLFFFWAFA